ncbi:ribonuclease H-like domain-containing protein [Hygrophoropsis aurantiaca]|uniref:Ribonuclease H-like domain-containing protein n=1 Tax=Hygrophoropsis aurantiaca TaxID=72124 RepID=A0ACB7ZSR5_9AGAM|nr:ribonuclease H-like domain-containing protein [Hygrophoropsis aurantiaca]
MRELSRLLWEEREIRFDPSDNRIPCFPHMLNLCVKHVIDEYKTANFTEVDETWNNMLDVPVKKEEYLTALQHDPIALARELVRVVRASGGRRKAFQDTIKAGNANKWFHDRHNNEGTLPVIELLRDVRTRWDSLYYCINRLRTLRQAINLFLASPRHSEIANVQMTAMEWEVLQDLEVVLEMPHIEQQKMSGEKTPRLGQAVPSFENLRLNWENLAVIAPHCAPYIAIGMYRVNENYQRMGRTRAYSITMCKHRRQVCVLVLFNISPSTVVDPCIRLTWIDQNWGLHAATQVRRDLIALVSD